TIKTNNWPVTSLCNRENAISERLTALSISSTHINSDMMLRWISTPITPMVNKTALSARYQESGTMFQFAPERSTNSSIDDLLFVFFFLLLASERILDAFDVFLLLAAREQHRADDRHQDQYRRGLERDQVISEHPVGYVFNRAQDTLRIGGVVRARQGLRRQVHVADDR